MSSPRYESVDSAKIAPVTPNTINNNAIGATFGKICDVIILNFVPPVTLAESTKGLTLTCKACDFTLITSPPRPPKVPSTIARCQILNLYKAAIINSKGNVGSIRIKSDCLIKYASNLPPQNAAIVPSKVAIPTDNVADIRPSANATWLPSII